MLFAFLGVIAFIFSWIYGALFLLFAKNIGSQKILVAIGLALGYMLIKIDWPYHQIIYRLLFIFSVIYTFSFSLYSILPKAKSTKNYGPLYFLYGVLMFPMTYLGFMSAWCDVDCTYHP